MGLTGLKAIIVALLAAISSCLPSSDPGPAGNPPATIVQRGSVLILGDSLTVGARDFGGLDELLAQSGWEAEIVAEGSKTVAWGLEQVMQRGRVPRTVLVALGSNPGPGLGTFPDEAASLIGALHERGAQRILWLPPHHADGTRYTERVSALLALENEGIDVLQWPDVAAANPQWYGTDGLHMTTEGYRGMATFIRDALDP